MLQRVLLATFSIRPHHATTEALSPPFPHFDPFGTEFREPGRISHPNSYCRLQLPIADLKKSLVSSSSIGNWQSEIGNYKDPSSFRRSS
jgi:hypothetical protein